MPSQHDSMVAELKSTVISVLRAQGFKGSYPHFRRFVENRVDLFSIQHDKWGGGFADRTTRRSRDLGRTVACAACCARSSQRSLLPGSTAASLPSLSKSHLVVSSSAPFLGRASSDSVPPRHFRPPGLDRTTSKLIPPDNSRANDTQL